MARRYVDVIEAEAAIKDLFADMPRIEFMGNRRRWREENEQYLRCLDVLRSVPTADAVEVVRCKDCKWLDLTDPCGTLTPNAHRCKRVTRLWMEDDAYCSYGERREDEKSTKRTD